MPIKLIGMKKRNSILFLTTAILFAALMYGPTLLEIFKAAIHREGSSHGLFIPFLSFYFIWRKRSRLKEIEMRISPEGLILVIIGLLLYFLEIGNERFYLQAFSFFILISGLVFFFMGKEFFKEVAFPVLFLVCMIPIPKEMYSAMAEHVRDITLGTSAWLLSLTNIPFIKENLVIHLPNVSLMVNLSCSGIRYLISFFVFGIAYAYIFRTRLFDRIFLVCLTIPLSLSASLLRLMAIFLSAYYIGPFMAQHTPHIIVSWFVFFIVLIGAILFDRILIDHMVLKNKQKSN